MITCSISAVIQWTIVPCIFTHASGKCPFQNFAIKRCGIKGQGCQRPQTAEADLLLHKAAKNYNARIRPLCHCGVSSLVQNTTRFCSALTLYSMKLPMWRPKGSACVYWVCMVDVQTSSLLVADDDVCSASGFQASDPTQYAIQSMSDVADSSCLSFSSSLSFWPS